MMKLSTRMCFALLLMAAFRTALPAADLVITAGRVITMTGEEFSPGAVIVSGETITFAGPATGAEGHKGELLEFPEGVLMPAFVEAHTQRGMPRQNENMPNAAFITAADNLNPVDVALDDAVRAGIATLLVIPGNDTVLGGRGLVIQPVGIDVEDLARIGQHGLKISLAPSGGRTRMEQVATLRSALEGAKQELAAKEAKLKAGSRDPRSSRKVEEPDLPWTNPDGGEDSGIDPRNRAVADLLRGDLFALGWCETAGDVAAAYRLADEYGFDLVPVLGPGAWRAADLLAERKATAVLGPELEHWERTPDGREEMHSLPAELNRAGVPFALTTSRNHYVAHNPLHQAAVAVREGVPESVTLEALTTVPARIAGLGDILGTLERGREATMILLSGDPLSSSTWVDRMWIAGEQVYDRAEDEALGRLLGAEEGAEEPHGHDEDAIEVIRMQRRMQGAGRR